MLRPWAAHWIAAVLLCGAVAQYSSDQCSWRGSGLSHESHRRDVEQVYLRCSQGSLEWLYPTGAIIVNLRPNTEPSSGHMAGLHVCIKPYTYSQGSHVYLERAGDLTLLLAEKDHAQGTVHCFSLAEGALFVEAVPQTDISRRITAFQYELVPSQGPGAHMYPYLHSGSAGTGIFQGVTSGTSDHAPVVVTLSRLFRQKSRVFAWSGARGRRWSGRINVPAQCGVHPGGDEYLLTGSVHFGAAWLGCAPRYKDFLKLRMRMWSLQNLLFTLCIVLSCVTSAAQVIHLFGYEGREAHVSCSYGEGYESYEKYLCRGDCGTDDVLIKTTVTKKGRYSIHDDKGRRVFTATISDLSLTDAGKYWCGVSRTGKDIYTEVRLEVGQDTCCGQSTKVQSYEEGSVSFSCPYNPQYKDTLKYICRGNQPSACLQQAVVTSDKQRNGQFRLTDDKGSKEFTVTITSLTQRDSGSYLCGVYRNTGLDVFSAVEVEVKEWCCVKTSELSGIVGDQVNMQCPYPPQHRHNRKFICKGDHRNNCADMVTSGSRFTLQDDVSSSSFMVTITELKAGDAGTYWCGSDSQWSANNYTKIQLSADAALFHPVVFIVPPIVIVMMIILGVVCKYKCVSEAAVNAEMVKTRAVEEEEDVQDDYENQDVVVRLKQQTSKPQRSYNHYDDADEDQQDSVYQNCSTTEDIYCNQNYIVGKRITSVHDDFIQCNSKSTPSEGTIMHILTPRATKDEDEEPSKSALHPERCSELCAQCSTDTCCGHSAKIQTCETGSVSFGCPYESQYKNNLKYICRGNQRSTCLQQAVVTSDKQQNGQFRLTDDKGSRKFTVTITSLTQGDSGSYLCDAALFHPVVFIVLPILILIIILGIVYRYKCHEVTRAEVTMGRNRTKSAEEEEDVQHEYENQDVVVHLKQQTSKPQRSYSHYDDAEIKKGRYSIHDDKEKRVFTATISDLSLTDAGKYLCGVSTAGTYNDTEVNMQVGQDTCCAQSTKIQRYETGSVSFGCPYKSQYENNLKYICRGNQPSTCLQQAVVTSDKQQNGQFRLTDDKRLKKFTVTITNLTQGDSGSYLCGVYRNTGLDVFSAVELDIKEWCCVKTSELSGIVGGQVNMQCPYPPQHRNNRKFICKGDHRNNCADMVTNGSRFTLQDDISSSSFMVTITELKASDAGTYWCGSDSQWSANNYTKIQLSADAAVFHPVVFIVPPILTLMIILGIVYRCHKVTRAEVTMDRNGTKSAEEEEDVQDYYENQDVVVRLKQQTSRPQRSYSHYDDAGEDQQDSVYQNCSTTEDIYCNQNYIEAINKHLCTSVIQP
ncbi:Meteorin-like protein [Nibea albiflora]|uniref:Meteorin-like protein n=1 Tax=Nibea albiflora TaxID=240163 RepID=A0ACB7FM43_NIBAL|nr:Meteorin-like protein [Nibea albiflora]